MSARITGQIIFMCPSNFLCILQAINTTERGATVHLFCILTDINVSSEVPLECSASQNILMVVDKNWMWIQRRIAAGIVAAAATAADDSQLIAEADD